MSDDRPLFTSLHFADEFLFFKPKSIAISSSFLFSLIDAWNKQDKCIYHANCVRVSFIYKNSADLVMTLLLISLTQVESFEMHLHLTLSHTRPISYRNQSIDLLCKSMDWFLYDIGLGHERVKS